jgi:lipopolysaccharide export system permease protein
VPGGSERELFPVRLIDRHIIRELVPLTLIALGVASGVFFLDKLPWMTSLVLQNRLDLGMSWRLLCYTLPTVSGLTLPIGFLMGCTLIFHRMSADSELVVLRAAGISVYRLLVPFFMVAMLACVLSAFALMYVSPWGYQGLQKLIFDIARDRAYYHLRPQAFNDAFKGLVFYVERIHPQVQRFEGIFVADNRSQVTQVITAEQGELFVHPEALQVVLRLTHGIIHRYVPANARYHLVRFRQYDVVLDLDTRLARQSTGSAGVREMFPHQLRAEIARREALGEDTKTLRLFWHKLFALSFACIIFAGLGPALGATRTRSGRSAGYLLSIAGIFVYYILLSASDALGEDSRLPPVLAAWLPNLCMGGFTTLLLRRHVHGSLRMGRTDRIAPGKDSRAED